MVKRTMLWIWLLFLLFVIPTVGLTSAQENLNKDTIYHIAWNESGDRIVSVDYTNTVTIWDAETQNSLLTISGISNNLSTIRWSPDGSQLAGNSYDGKIYVWDAMTGNLIQSISEDTPSLSLIWIADGNQILTGIDGIDGNPEIRRWDIHTGKLITSYSVGGALLYVNPEDTILATVPTYKLELHDLATLESIATLSNDGDYDKGYQTSSVTWSSDGNLIASGYLNGMARIWDVKTAKIINDFKANEVIFENHGLPASTVIALAFTSKNTLLSSVSRDGSIRRWEIDTGKLIIKQQLATSVTAADWSPDGKRLAMGSEDGTISIWEVATG